MREIINQTTFSNHYSNEEIAFSIGKIARENYSIKNSGSKPHKISRRHLVGLLNEKHENLNLADTLEVNELVKLSYKINSSIVREAIVETIKENIGNDSVYNPKRLYPSNNSLFSGNENGELSAKVNLLENNVAEVDSEQSKTKIDKTLIATQKLEFKKEFLGIGNADSAREYALNVLKGYESMIEEYDKIKNINLNLINDFLILRNELKAEREDVVQLLIDLLGGSAKKDYPHLFDFSQIEWMDFENSWRELNLSYNEINNTHQEFLNVIDAALEDFGNAISSESRAAWKKISRTSKRRELRQEDLVGAGVQIAFAAGASLIKGAIESRNKSKEVVAIIQRDVELIKNKMSQDNELIIADIFRLGKLYSRLSHSLLPNYQKFIRSNSQYIASHLKPIYEKILENPIIYETKHENIEHTKRQRFLLQKIIDFKNNKEYSIQEEKRLGEILEFQNYEYQIAQSLKPKKPNALIAVFTWGRAVKIFEGAMKEWTLYCKPVISDYEYLQHLKGDEINKRQEINENISGCERELDELTQRIKVNSELIRTEFNKNPVAQNELVKLMSVVMEISDSSKSVLEVEIEKELQKEASYEFQF